MFTYSHANTPLGQSEHAYYLSNTMAQEGHSPVLVFDSSVMVLHSPVMVLHSLILVFTQSSFNFYTVQFYFFTQSSSNFYTVQFFFYTVQF